MQAQLTDGAYAPNFYGTDIDGNPHNLHDLLEQDKAVILDFSTTWCGPCWSYHNIGALHDFMETYGPEGTDEAMVFYIECDPTTNMDDLNGTGGRTLGDWVSGTNYPILDYSYIANQYQVGSYPTILMVCPDRKLTSIGTLSLAELISAIGTCPTSLNIPVASFYADEYFSCDGSLEVAFTDASWPRGGSYLWDFGDGQKSTETHPVHQYTEPGTYAVTLEVENKLGTGYSSETNIIVGEGMNESEISLGAANNEIGGGRIIPEGQQGLIFDAYEDIVISSVYVYSDRAADRTIVLLDANRELINIKTVFIPEGETRIDLDLFVAQGTDLTLGLYSDAYLYRNSSGADYPYEIDNLVCITKNSAGSNYYFYYYDWKVRSATCSEVSNNEELLAAKIEISPNPASHLLRINSDLITEKNVHIYDLLGNEMKCNNEIKDGEIYLDIAHFKAGIYLVSIEDIIRKFTKK